MEKSVIFPQGGGGANWGVKTTFLHTNAFFCQLFTPYCLLRHNFTYLEVRERKLTVY